MFGAIVGDIIGSVYEWNNIKTKEFPLFRDDCHFTDFPQSLEIGLCGLFLFLGIWYHERRCSERIITDYILKFLTNEGR